MRKEENKSYRCYPYMQQSIGYTTKIDDKCSVNKYPVDPCYGYPGFYGYGSSHYGWSHHGSHRDGVSMDYPTRIDVGEDIDAISEDVRQYPIFPGYGYLGYRCGLGWLLGPWFGAHHGWGHGWSHHGWHRD